MNKYHQKNKNNMKCFICGSYEHIARKCNLKREQNDYEHYNYENSESYKISNDFNMINNKINNDKF